MASTSRTTRIVPEDRPAATGLTVDGAIDSYRLSLRAANNANVKRKQDHRDRVMQDHLPMEWTSDS